MTPGYKSSDPAVVSPREFSMSVTSNQSYYVAKGYKAYLILSSLKIQVM